MNRNDMYTEEHEFLTLHLAKQLRIFAGRNYKTVSPHGIATAFIGVGTEVALSYLSPSDVARWLRLAAKDIESIVRH